MVVNPYLKSLWDELKSSSVWSFCLVISFKISKPLVLSPTLHQVNVRVIFNLIGVLPKYFSSEWSVAQFRLIEGSQYIVAFGHQKNTVVILGLDGRWVDYVVPTFYHGGVLSSIIALLSCWYVFPWMLFLKWGLYNYDYTQDTLIISYYFHLLLKVLHTLHI